MGKRMIAFCDTDEVFVRRFSGYFRRNREMEAEIMIYSDIEKFTESQEKDQCEIWVLGNGFEQFASEETKATVVLLREELEADCPYLQVEKYQEASGIIRGIAASKKVPEHSFADLKNGSSHGKEVLAVIAPFGHRCEVGFSVALAQYLGKQKNVLYVSLSSCFGFSELHAASGTKDVSDLLYLCMRDRTADEESERLFYDHLEQCMCREDQLLYLPPADNPLLLYEADREAYEMLLERLLRKRDFDVLILELGMMHQGFFSLLTSCDQVYCLEETGAFSTCGRTAFQHLCQRQMEAMGHSADELEQKMQRICFSVNEDVGSAGLSWHCEKGILYEAVKQAYEKVGKEWQRNGWSLLNS